MDRIITLLCAMVLAAGLGLAWDRHPPLGLHVPVLWWRVGFDLPDSLATQLEKSQRDLSLAQTDERSMASAMELQNGTITAAAKKGDAAKAATRADLAVLRGPAARAEAASAALRSYRPQGADACARWTDEAAAVHQQMVKAAGGEQ